MANTKPNKKEPGVLTKRQASVLNKSNRNISGNINALMDNINNMTYGISRTDKIDKLNDQFNSLLKKEVDSITKTTDGDTTSFITKLFSENNKKLAANMTTIESMFNVEEGQLEAFLQDKYQNRLIKQADLHEVSRQLTELQEAITITRDAIISPDIVDGHMSRNITIDDYDDEDDYLPLVEQMEKKFELQKKIKNFIIPKTLEYGEYYVYCVPYSKIFEDFSKEKENSVGSFHAYEAYSDAKEISLFEFVNGDKERRKSLNQSTANYVKESAIFEEQYIAAEQKVVLNNLPKELDAYLKNVTICNNPVPIPIIEEGVNSYREYYTEFVEKTVTEADDKEFSFNNVMKNIDSGVHIFDGKKKQKRNEKFGNIKDCYIKLIDPMKLLPIEIMNEVIGYYYIQEEDISPLSGILTSTVYYDKFDNNRNENNILSSIAETIVAAFDKKFLENNLKFKKLIVEALNYYKLNNKKIKFQFIPKEFIIPFKINDDENGHGRSIIEPSLFYAKLYLMLLLFKMMTIILNSNDTKINYIKQSGIEKNIMNKVQEIARKKQSRQITLTDMFSYTTLINKIGQGSEMYVPVGKSDKRAMETEILAGQDVQLNTDLMEMLKKAYISGTGVPDVLLNYLHEAEFAKTLELANNRFQGRVISFQLDFNEQITALYRQILRYSTTMPEDVVDSVEFNFIQAKYSNSNITNDLLNNHNSLQDFLIQLYYGQEGMDDPKNADSIMRFKRLLAKDRLSMLNFTELDDLYKKAQVEGTRDQLNPNKNQEE